MAVRWAPLASARDISKLPQVRADQYGTTPGRKQGIEFGTLRKGNGTRLICPDQAASLSSPEDAKA